MPMFDAITPVRQGGKITPPGKPVELDAATGATLVALGAVAPIAGKTASTTEPAADKPLAKMNKAELLAIAAAEEIAVAEDATNKQIVVAIEAKRSAQ